MGGEVAAGEDVGVGEQVEHEGHGKAGDDAPAAAKQIFNNGVEVGAGRVVGGGLENHQAAGEHGEPGIEQHDERSGKPDAGGGGGIGEHACADDGAGDDHGAAEYGGFLIHGDVGMEWVWGMVKALDCFLRRRLILLIAKLFAARRRIGSNYCFCHTLWRENKTAAQISSGRAELYRAEAWLDYMVCSFCEPGFGIFSRYCVFNGVWFFMCGFIVILLL